jgi:hypothetical protein
MAMMGITPMGVGMLQVLVVVPVAELVAQEQIKRSDHQSSCSKERNCRGFPQRQHGKEGTHLNERGTGEDHGFPGCPRAGKASRSSQIERP